MKICFRKYFSNTKVKKKTSKLLVEKIKILNVLIIYNLMNKI